MLKNTKMIATFVAAGAMLAAPAAGLAAKGGNSAAAKGKAKACATAKSVSYQVSGTFVSAVADDPATPANEGTITMTVTSANVHAAKSGEIADQNATKKGVQVKGATMTIAATDAFVLKLNGYEAPDTPSAGDKVKVSGKIALTKKRCVVRGRGTVHAPGPPRDSAGPGARTLGHSVRAPRLPRRRPQPPHPCRHLQQGAGAGRCLAGRRRPTAASTGRHHVRDLQHPPRGRAHPSPRRAFR